MCEEVVLIKNDNEKGKLMDMLLYYVATRKNEVTHANKRILARLIDVTFVFVIYYALAKITQYKTVSLTPVPRILTQNFLIMYVSSLLTFWLCNLVLIIRNGQTFGKRFTKLKIVTKGNEISYAVIFIRELFFYSGITPFITITGTQTTVNIIDMITSSHVVAEKNI